MTTRKSKRLYLIPVLSKALDILELLQNENQPMTLEAIHRQTKISKTTVYRVLKTFVHRGYLVQSPDGLYRQVSRPKKIRFGFGGQSETDDPDDGEFDADDGCLGDEMAWEGARGCTCDGHGQR